MWWSPLEELLEPWSPMSMTWIDTSPHTPLTLTIDGTSPSNQTPTISWYCKAVVGSCFNPYFPVVIQVGQHEGGQHVQLGPPRSGSARGGNTSTPHQVKRHKNDSPQVCISASQLLSREGNTLALRGDVSLTVRWFFVVDSLPSSSLSVDLTASLPHPNPLISIKYGRGGSPQFTMENETQPDLLNSCSQQISLHNTPIDQWEWIMWV